LWLPLSSSSTILLLVEVAAVEGESIQLPVLGNTVLDILRHDHQVITRLLGDLRQAGTTETRGSALISLRAALLVHNSTEELFFYPALATIAHKKAESQHLYHDTAEANILMFDLEVLLQVGAELEFDLRAKTLQDAITEHAANEEATAFVDLQERGTLPQLEMLTSSVREFRSSFHFYPTSMPASI
jgi:hypothetical protein